MKTEVLERKFTAIKMKVKPGKTSKYMLMIHLYICVYVYTYIFRYL